MKRSVFGMIGFMLIVGVSTNSLTSCSSFGECGPPNAVFCADRALWVGAPCEIVGCWTTCINNVTCLHGECSVATTHDETCSITVVMGGSPRARFSPFGDHEAHHAMRYAEVLAAASKWRPRRAVHCEVTRIPHALK